MKTISWLIVLHLTLQKMINNKGRSDCRSQIIGSLNTWYTSGKGCYGKTEQKMRVSTVLTRKTSRHTHLIYSVQFQIIWVLFTQTRQKSLGIYLWEEIMWIHRGQEINKTEGWIQQMKGEKKRAWKLLKNCMQTVPDTVSMTRYLISLQTQVKD